MARHTDLAGDVEGGSWRPSTAQLGWIIENRLDEAYVLSWPGQLETYVPLHDTGGYDRARAPGARTTTGSIKSKVRQVFTRQIWSRCLSVPRRCIRAGISISRSLISFMSSTEFAKLASGKGAYLLFTTTLNPAHSNRWTPYRIPTSDAATLFKVTLRASSSRRAA